MKLLAKLKTFVGGRGKKSTLAAAGIAATAIAAPSLVLASSASTDTDFQEALDLVIGWAQGTLGKLAAISMLVVGIVMGVMRQSIFAAVPAIAAAVCMYVGPTVIDSVFSAVLPTV
ncbi:hypothetical protein A3715_17165 [Oleiphilus sp. HI0009]|nr:hypothetical protein A3715_17165 [Oleiphilus sp. HI0009]